MKRSWSPLALAVLLATPFLYGVFEPLFGSPATIVLACLFLTAAGALLLRPAWMRRIDRALSKRALAVNLGLAFLTVGVTAGAIELAAQALVDLGWLSVYSPMRTLLPAGTADWRYAHITADRHREPDPILLWRPAAHAPYNAQRMKGPIAQIPKPPGVLRIMAYGDSNTDGPDQDGWTEHLADAVARHTGRDVEVLNAGVAGYSSHQGLLRFQEDVSRFEPDVVLVSFGWNDLATPRGLADKSYVPPPAWRIALERVAIHYEAVLALRRQLLEAAPPGEDWAAEGAAHRVSEADYAANLRAFGQVARAHGAQAVLLTRPYRLPTATLLASDGWRRNVPRYNQRLLTLSTEQGIPAVDVQAAFENAEDLFADECHFTPEGHQKMAVLVADALIATGVVAAAGSMATGSTAPDDNGRGTPAND